MSRAGLLRRTPFRLALLCALVFAGACAIGVTVTVALVAGRLESRLDALVDERWASVASEYRAGDVDAFVALVDAHARVANPRRSLYRLDDTSGRNLAGTPGIGFGRFGLFTAEGAVTYRVRGARLGPLSLWVGIGLGDSADIVALVRESLAHAILAALLATLGAGLLLARRSERRLAAIERALHAIADGELGTRLPLSGRADDIDAIADGFNGTVGALQRSLVALEQTGTDIAHDLKTPIARLGAALETAQAQLARDAPADGALADSLAAAHEDVAALGRIVDALLRIARLERGERRAAFTRLDVAALLATLVEDYAPLAEDAGTTLRLVEPPDTACIDGDAASLTQLFANLVENALRHGGTGAVVTLSVTRDARHLHVEVADDGPGIPLAERERVFRRLYRLERSRSTPGNGLGLSLAAAIARLHGGTITLGDNDPGLVVRVSLPTMPSTFSERATIPLPSEAKRVPVR